MGSAGHWKRQCLQRRSRSAGRQKKAEGSSGKTADAETLSLKKLSGKKETA
jgi:hypothetical protein